MGTNQEQTVLSHLEVYGSITQIEATMEYGITRLSAVIFELRRKGINIVTVFECGVNRFGNAVRYARYKLGD